MYIALTIKNIPADFADIAAALLMKNGCEGIEYNEDGLVAFITEKDYAANDFDTLLTQWQQEWHCTITQATIPDTNWNAEWEKNFTPLVIANRISIRAPFHPEVPGIDYDIVIEPKMSFGTGHHATTSMMMQWLLELPLQGKKVLDVGTGTGILAILAEKLGAIDITATDNDDWCLVNSAENTAINDCHHITILSADSFKPTAGYDLIIANIQRSYFEENIPLLASLLNPGGVLITSGYLHSDDALVKDYATKAGLTYTGTKQEGEWLSHRYNK